MSKVSRLREFPAPAILLLFLAAAGTYMEFRLGMQPIPAADPVAIAAEHFRKLRDSLPPHGEACYLTDTDLQSVSFSSFYLAEYSIAPIVLKLGADCEIVIGDFVNPTEAPGIIKQNGLQVVRRFDAGLMLLKRTHQ
jgi:hypothetical protein